VNDEIADTRDGLRGASDGLMVAIQEVEQRERLKRGVPPTDPGFPALAREVTIAAKAVLELARVEEAEADAIAARQVAPLPTIEATPPPERLADILTEWRAVERHLEAVDATSPEAAELMQAFEALRDRYAQALKAYRG
jgi:hypothetical protein